MRLLLAAFLSLLWATACFAAELPVADPSGGVAIEAGGEGEPSLDELMSRVIDAYGGEELLLKWESASKSTGHQRVPGTAYDVVFRQARKGRKVRVELTNDTEGLPHQSDSAYSITAYDGTAAWKSVGKWVSSVDEVSADLIAQEVEHMPFALVHWQDKNWSARLLGRTTYKQMPVFAVELKRNGHMPTTFFIDAQSYLVVGAGYQGRDPETKKLMRLGNDFSAYKPVDGLQIPHRQGQYVNGRLVFQLDLEDVEIGKAADDSLFKRPEQALRLPQPVVFPFSYNHGQIIVKARMNDGEPQEFLFDTGASDTIIDRRTAAEHFLGKQGRFNISAYSTVMTAATSTLEKLEIANLVLDDVYVVLLDLSDHSRQLGRKISGIIGNNILSQFAVTIDFSKHQIVLRDGATYEKPEGAASVSFTQSKGPVIEALLNGKEQQAFLVDTGAAFNHLSASIGKKYAQGQPQHLTEGRGLDGVPVKLGNLTMDSVSVAGVAVTKVNFTYPYQETIQAADPGAFQGSKLCVLGNPFWQNFIMTVDYRGQKLILQTNPVLRAKREIEQCTALGDTKLIIHREYREAQTLYQKALTDAQRVGDAKNRARLLGRLANLYRVMAKDLNRQDQKAIALDYFKKAQMTARMANDREVEGRILADWGLFYSDSGQAFEAKQTLENALAMAPQDPQVNVNFAVYLYRARMFPDMQKFVEKALFLDPANWQALWYRVKINEMYGDIPELKETLKEILRFYPWSKLAQQKLAELSQPPASPPVVQSDPGLQPPTRTPSQPVSEPPRPLLPALRPIVPRSPKKESTGQVRVRAPGLGVR